MISRTDNKGPPLSWAIGIMAVVAWAIVAGADRYILHIGIGMRPGLVVVACTHDRSELQ